MILAKTRSFLNNFHSVASQLYSKTRHFQIRFLSTGSEEKDWTIDDVTNCLQRVNNVVVMAGAGISTPSGIVDFRTPGTGLYYNLEKYNLPYAEAIFELDYFFKNPKPFFTLAKDLYPGKYKPNVSHYFCKLLQEKGKLLRMYTQNIDGLERMAGISSNKLVEAHGTFSSATCTSCQKAYDGQEIRKQIFDDQIPKCTVDKCQGIIKPDIVFFGEQLPRSFYKYAEDLSSAEILLVMGSSLQVDPFASLAEMVTEDIPRVLLNSDPVRSFVCSDRPRDVLILGDVAKNIHSLTEKLCWKNELETLNRKQ